MDRSALRTSLRDRYGLSPRGIVGDARMNRDINHALRTLWGELPEMLLREEMRLRLEPVVNTATLKVVTGDPLVMQVESTTLLVTDGTLRGRWIDIIRSDQVYSRRVRDVFTYKPGGGTPDASRIVLDEPWDNTTDSGLKYRIYAQEYMLPADVSKVREVFRCVNQVPVAPNLLTAFPEEMNQWRLGSWDQAGTIQAVARGALHTIPAPHYTPTTTKQTGDLANTQKWGWDGSGVEHGSAFAGARFGAAGTFSYKVCHVWGRAIGINPTQENLLRPWLISAASPASAQVTTTWGGSHITVNLPDYDYIAGYGLDSTLPSYHHHGAERFIFRARHATQAAGIGNNAYATFVENDEVYYLWRVVQGYDTSTIDRGDDDPPDRRFMLKDFQGHQSLRFDRTPTAKDDIVLSVIRRPPTMDHDSDEVRVPPECIDAFMELIAAHILGDKDGEPARKSAYFKSYEKALGELRAQYSFSGHDRGSFGNGIGPRAAVRVVFTGV